MKWITTTQVIRPLFALAIVASVPGFVALPPHARGATTLSSVTLSPASVTSGSSSQGSVVLSGAVTSRSGAPVSLASSNPSVATVPSSVTVAYGKTTASFTVSTQSVSGSTPVSVSISATYGGVKKTAALTVSPMSTAPVITKQPTSQTVNVGQMAAFTVTASGSSVSYQWQRSNSGASTWANVSAGTGGATANYTTAAATMADNGAKFRVNVANATGSVTSSTATLTVKSPGTLAVADFENYRVFQRDIGGVSAGVTITGSCANMTWAAVEARVLRQDTNAVVVDWTPIDSTPDGATFAGLLTVPQGGWYSIDTRAVDANGTVLGSSQGTHKWGVGMNILVIGQSNMSGHGRPPFTAVDSDLAANFSNAGVWEHLADPYDHGSPPDAVDSDNDVIEIYGFGGSMVPAIANSLLETFDFPIAFVPSPKGGSPLHDANGYGWVVRNPANHFDTSTLYGQSITKAQRAGGVELIIMNQGTADALDGRTKEQYMTDFATMIGNFREDLRPNIPIFICQIGTMGVGTDDGVAGIRGAQNDVDNWTDIFLSSTSVDLPRDTELEFDTPQLNVMGKRMANAIKYYFWESSYDRGPGIYSATFSDANRTQILVQLDHRGGTDFTPAAGITGFEVLDNGSKVVIQSAVRDAANKIRLTLAQPIPEGHWSVTLRYLYGLNPDVTGMVKDNTPLALPLECTPADLEVW